MFKRLLGAILLFISSFSFGSHIVGGEFELIYICPNTYRLNLVLYFDAINGFPTLKDQDVYAHIFRRSDNKLMQVEFLPKILDEDVPYFQEWCDNNEVETLRIIYGDTITLEDANYSDPLGYYVAWENCCRNYDVTNVVVGGIPNVYNDPENPGPQSGQTYFLQFPPIVKNGQPFINSTPSGFPALNSYACPNFAYYANFAGIDPDGDSLIYSIVSPLDNLPGRESEITRPGPYPDVVWVEGFGPAKITGGDPDMKITKSGFLTVTPKFVGLFVFAVRVDEWRDGEHIGIIQREFQLYVDDLCEPSFAPVIESKLSTQSLYSDVGQLIITFNNTVSLEDRCINIKISDLDASNDDENISIQAIALNFDDEVRSILPADSVFILKNGSSKLLDICFPECPFLDPFENEVMEIGIIVRDDSCPLALIDTLRLEVRIEAPFNQLPYIEADGIQSPDYNRLVTESAGGSLSFPIIGFDDDNQPLTMEIIPVNDFDPKLAGMSFSDPVSSPGMISTQFSWDYDCANELLEFSEGLDVSISTASTRRLYEFLILVEDKDDCEFSRADTLQLNLTIEFPGEAHPNVFLPDENMDDDYFMFDYDLSETINLDIKALDGYGDDDLLNLFAIGEGFDLAELGASFPEITGGDGREPGTSSTFTWPLLCDKLKVEELDTFRTYFIVTDIDMCHLENTDTLTIDFIVHAGENEDPELSIQNIAGEEPVVDNTLKTDFSKKIRFNLVGNDPNYDSLYLRLLYVNGTKNLDDFKFETVKGLGTVSSEFSLDLGCDKLGDGFSEATYQFTFLLEDRNCANSGTDTLSFNLIVSDILIDDDGFLPANVFTPNGDGVNDFFGMSSYDEFRNEKNILPLDNCLGQFKSVSIINRYGKEVYFSSDRNFEWLAEGLPAGVYYYLISYTDKVYKGTVTALF